MSKNLLHWHSYMLFQKKPLATNTTSDTKQGKFWGVRFSCYKQSTLHAVLPEDS